VTEVIRIEDTGAAGAVGAVIATAFHELPVSAWIIPPDEDRRRMLPPYFALFAEHALRYGDVYATADLSGVAVWFPNDSAPLPDIPDYDAKVEAITGHHAERCAALDAEMARHHPHDPHHYLAFLAVLPGSQGRGLGSLLLAEHHGRLDAAGVAGYLEASSAGSRRLYLRHGYQDLGEPLTLPDGPPMFPMWRPPNA
jgi:GNAT superfamily N-acetyltransferase